MTAATAKSTCRSCAAYCPVNVTLDDGRVVKVEGNPDAPLYEGFICPRGRALAAAHNDGERLLHSMKRMPDGSYQPISSVQLVEEISTRLKHILDQHGPRAFAGFHGGPAVEHQALGGMMRAFLQAIGSDNFYGDNTIDQPNNAMADALHGTWAGGRTRIEKCDLFLMVGGNPVISKQYFAQNPGQQLKRMVKQGTTLIVIDPRRSETAKRAQLHLQCIPGEDPTIIAGLVHLVIANGAVNKPFVELNAAGFEQLSAAVSAFTPDYVAERAGIDEADLREAARLIGTARRGDFGSGVGPSMATRGTLTSYLLRCLQTLRGFWAEQGDDAVRPRVMFPRLAFKAQPNPPRPAWGYGRKLRMRGLEDTVAGMPVAALPGEILTPGDGQVRALFLHAGAMLAWPQTELVHKALESLDLLVVHDVEMSATSRVADYVIATRKPFEVPYCSQFGELVGIMHPGYGWEEPYAAYSPALLDPPEEADLMEAWQIYYRIARKFGLQLRYRGALDAPGDAQPLDMAHEPTTDELFDIACRNATIPLAEVKQHPNGKIFDAAREAVGPRDAACTARLELANPDMLAQLKQVRAESILQRRGTSAEYPLLYIPVRKQNSYNAAYRPQGMRKTGYNPAYMHASDLASLGVVPGDMVEIRSQHGAILGIVDVDDNLRPGVLSMCHGFGRNAGEDYDPRRDGANVNRLLHWEDDFDPYHGMPRMSAVPIAVRRVG